MTFYTLGIESSANKIGVGIISSTKTNNKEDICILSNVRATYTPPPGQGVIPVDAAEHHRAQIFVLIEKALEESNLKITDIDLYTYTKGPGMHQLLTVGCTVARTLSLLHKKPLIPVNHCIAHIEMGRHVTGAENPVVLYASGGNTQIINRSGGNKNSGDSTEPVVHSFYKIYGETLDVAVGNCLDKVARALGLDNYPSPGLSIELAARKNTHGYIPLPYSMKGMDMSFSGIFSEIFKIIKLYDQNYAKKSDGTTNDVDSVAQKLKDTSVSQHLIQVLALPRDEFVSAVCFSLQETIYSILIEATERCCSFVGSNEVLVVGGVGCNMRLQEMMEKMVKQRGGKLHAMDERYCIDNGAMIAYTGYIMFKAGYKGNMKDCFVTQRYRTDSVGVFWE